MNEGHHGNGANSRAGLELPDGRTIGEADLIPLWRDDYTDPEKIHLIVKDDGGYRVDPRGFPLVVGYTSPPKDCEPGGARKNAHVTLRWSNGPSYGQHTVSVMDVETNRYLGLFGFPLMLRGDKSRFADIVKAQIWGGAP